MAYQDEYQNPIGGLLNKGLAAFEGAVQSMKPNEVSGMRIKPAQQETVFKPPIPEKTQASPVVSAATSPTVKAPDPNTDRGVEDLTKRQGGLTVVGGLRRPDVPVLSGKMASEVDALKPVTEQQKPATWGREMSMDNVMPGEAMVKSYSPETTRTRFDSMGYQTQEKIPGTPTMVGYRQNEQTGKLEKFDASGNKVGDLGYYKPHKDAEKNTAMFWANNGMPGGAEQYRQERKMEQEKQKIYLAMDNMMSNSMNPMLSPDARANAAKALDVLASRANAIEAQSMQAQNNQLQAGLTRETNKANRELAAAQASYTRTKDDRNFNLDQEKLGLEKDKAKRSEYGVRDTLTGETEMYPKSGPAAEDRMKEQEALKLRAQKAQAIMQNKSIATPEQIAQAEQILAQANIKG